MDRIPEMMIDFMFESLTSQKPHMSVLLDSDAILHELRLNSTTDVVVVEFL